MLFVGEAALTIPAAFQHFWAAGTARMSTLLDELRGRALGEPPRHVPLLVRVRVLFGGQLSQMGWFFFGFGMIFFWLFACHADLTSWTRFRGKLATAEGIVTDSRNTGATVGGSKGSRGTPVYENEFKFVVDDREYQGVSYATGRHLRIRQKVTVEYVPDKPQFARIRGMRADEFGPEVLFVTIFPLIGLCAVVFSLRRGVKACDLLAHGVQATGNLISKEATNIEVNKRTVYKFTFGFKTPDSAFHNAVSKTHLVERFENPTAEPLVYDPKNPERAVMLDNLPGAPHINEAGEIVVKSPWKAIALLIIPAATIIGHSIWAIAILKR